MSLLSKVIDQHTDRMRYLIISDIHANIDALEAITESYDKLLVLGDLVDYGAAPEEVVRWVRDKNPIAISGNHDYAMATGADCRSSPISYTLSVATREYFRPLLSEEVLRYLRERPHRYTITESEATIHLVHATPRDPLFEYLNGNADDSTWRSAVGDLAEREGYLFLGHTHQPFVRNVGRLTIVNPGSLGMPIDGDRRACYAIWDDGEIQLKRVNYDVERAIERLAATNLSTDVIAKMSSVLRYAGRGG